MTDPGEQGKPMLPQPGYPGPNFATAFADGVTSVSPGPEVVKIYLSRIDPNFVVENPAAATTVAQLIMPTSGFLQTAAFFMKVVDGLISSNFITKEQYDEIKSRAGNK